MSKDTQQQQFWQSDFGKEYNVRNILDPENLDRVYRETYGVSRTDMNNEFLKDLSVETILEIGCNVGDQLRFLQKQGYSRLYGIDIQESAIAEARRITSKINVIQGSAFDVPFRDNYFDLVFTSGVLIHISPDDVHDAMAEIHRLTKRYIWGFEYFYDTYEAVPYRGHEGFLWRGNFAQMYLDQFPDLKLVKTKDYPYLVPPNVDQMFLLEKI